MSDPFLAHIISQTRQNIEFLVSRNVIPRADGDVVLAKLPSASDASVLALSQRTQDLVISGASAPNPTPPPRRNVPPPPPRATRARALWDYNENGENPDDLSFRKGDIIEIISETNPDWWTGRLNGRQGLLPANYVEKLDSTSSPAPPPPFPSNTPQYQPDPRQYTPSPAPGYQAAYSPPPGPPGGYGPEKAAPYNPYMGPPMQPNPPVPVVQAPQPPPAPAAKPSRFGGLGNTLATSAVGGLGFGAGSAIGSDLINSIF
ncbi:SH3-domain-containing protein [Gloeophyllum trabeum ATCC 11539]|uniref:SH3-domain-containing protein n=1 Tax=Gloeophyllum trabeum (strain ATCC 11539 / FP-39264 / Madison 617) TaxID=670483 RepID=S7Q4B2_GLOTA|nr:SH3-domain-containing protein [Gloeophyllum trabeum ATCC 11539]EPQ54313.1 SH3-domain-containing protein [Gloeophyllum trabeum ATCC 11539]